MTKPAEQQNDPQSDPKADPQAEQRAQNTQYYLRALHHLLDISGDIASLVQRQAHDRPKRPNCPRIAMVKAGK